MASKNAANGGLSGQDDFDTKELTRNVRGHAKDLSNLDSRISKLEEKFGSNEKVAETLLETSKTALKMQTMLEESFHTLIQKNEPIKAEIRKIIASCNWNSAFQILRRIGSVTGALLFVGAGSVVTILVQHLMHVMK